MTGLTEPPNDLTANVAAFCGLLRTGHGFAIGHREARDALRAVEAVGIGDAARVRRALRLVCCATPDETGIFDRLFDAFFFGPPGFAQSAYAPRHTRPGQEAPDPAGRARRRTASRDDPDDAPGDSIGGTAGLLRPVENEGDDAAGWQKLRARYSPIAGRGAPLELDAASLTAMRHAAGLVVRSVRLGRSRRWKTAAGGSRFDVRRTMRASLETGGDPVALRFLGHPARNPRFVVLIDGSRSMAEHTRAVLTFAAALCERAARTSVFTFSTGLRDVTRDLRELLRTGTSPGDLGEAWGGGTRIGANLARFVDEHGARLLSGETVVMTFSDGLDAGDLQQLTRAIREIDRRSAAIIWLNPHVASPGFSPLAGGMRAALPYITLLAAADTADAFVRLAARIARTPRIRGRNG